MHILYGNVRNERISFGNKHIMYWELCTCEHLLNQRKSMESHPLSDFCALLTFAFFSTHCTVPNEVILFPFTFTCYTSSLNDFTLTFTYLVTKIKIMIFDYYWSMLHQWNILVKNHCFRCSRIFKNLIQISTSFEALSLTLRAF